MRIGLVELLLILLIAALTIGPSVAIWVERWMRRARRTTAAAARRRADQETQRAIEREAVLHRFQVLSLWFALFAVGALVWALVLRPIDTPPNAYTVPEVAQRTASVSANVTDTLELSGYRDISCIREHDSWLYLSAQEDSKSGSGVLLRIREDGSGLAVILTMDGEITGFDFDPEGDLWFTTVTADGGALCHAGYDGWGAAVEQVVSQIDGKALACPAAVVVAQDGRVYFTDAAAVSTKNGVGATLRTELMAHTATGWVYVYDPISRSVQRVLGGIAGASGLALDEDAGVLYVSDLGNRCIWSVSPSGRELTAGGKGCAAFAQALPGYPGALALDEDGSVYVSYRWARSGWLEDHADATLLRGAALRLSQTMQEDLFSLPADGICAEVFDTDGVCQTSFGGKPLGSAAGICPVGNRVYLSLSGERVLRWVRI